MAGSNYRLQTDRFGVEDFSLFKNANSREVEGCFPLHLFLLFFVCLPSSLPLSSFSLIWRGDGTVLLLRSGLMMLLAFL